MPGLWRMALRKERERKAKEANSLVKSITHAEIATVQPVRMVDAAAAGDSEVCATATAVDTVTARVLPEATVLASPETTVIVTCYHGRYSAQAFRRYDASMSQQAVASGESHYSRFERC